MEKTRRTVADVPSLIQSWDYQKNEIDPSSVSCGSRRKFWWRCRRGHQYVARVDHRYSGSTCPYCTGRKVLPGFNDLATLRPDIAAEWDYEKNGSITPRTVTVGSHKCVWWTCKKGHSYSTAIYHRTSHGSDCPYCSGQAVLEGFNDLKTIKPELAAEWHPVLNGSVLPEHVSWCSRRKAFWLCSKCGHIWKATVRGRAAGRGCPVCKESKGEKRIALYLSSLNQTYERQFVIKDCKYKRSLPFDFAIFDDAGTLRFLIEYDGEQHYECGCFSRDESEFQSTKLRDMIKNEYCAKHNIPLLRIPYFEFKNTEKLVEEYLIRYELLPAA